MLTAKSSKNSSKVTKPVTEKRCALHAKNFSEENEVRAIDEFYGDGKSSYCKRCMKIHHKERRIRLSTEVNREKAIWKRFHDSLEKIALEIIEKDLDATEITKTANAEMSELIERYRELNEEWRAESDTEEE